LSNAARKARKKAGEKFVHAQKEPTPLVKRRSYQALPAKVQRKVADDRGITLTKREQEVLGRKRPPKIRSARNYSR
jgi:hypothetical protein